METKDSMSVAEFCARHSISRAFFYKLAVAGLAPRTIRLGSRVLISKEAAKEWRRQREASTNTTAA